MFLTPEQQQHETLIQTAYERFAAAKTRSEMVDASQQMARLIRNRDAEVANALERERMERARA